MTTIQTIVRQINRELVPQFEEKLHAYLLQQDKAWLIEQIIRLTLDVHSLQEMDRKMVQEMKLQRRQERVYRLRELRLDHEKLAAFLAKYQGYQRAELIEADYLLATAPIKGTDLITDKFRSQAGQALLTLAKDILFGLLFGDATTETQFERKEQKLLTLTLPRHKGDALDFMKATTELSALGTWQDMESVSNDLRADNLILEVEYGEIAGELISQGVIRTLSLINNLEVNEQILYARMMRVEQSTLIE